MLPEIDIFLPIEGARRNFISKSHKCVQASAKLAKIFVFSTKQTIIRGEAIDKKSRMGYDKRDMKNRRGATV